MFGREKGPSEDFSRWFRPGDLTRATTETSQHWCATNRKTVTLHGSGKNAECREVSCPHRDTCPLAKD